MTRARVYLDHAATSWPKPEGVLEACNLYQNEIGVAAARGAYRSCDSADRMVNEVRTGLAKLIGSPSPEHIAFTSNGTMALNAAILGFFHQPDLSDQHVVTSATEHNSVLRPLAMLAKTRGLQWTIVKCDTEGYVSAQAMREAIRPNTQLLIINHASNVTGAIQDLSAMAEVARAHGIAWMVDAAQSLGFLPIDVDQLGIDLLAAPCHKGVGGLMGTGCLFASGTIQERLQSPWIGGTGRSSDSLIDSFSWRESIESGNMNLPGIASVGAGVRWLDGSEKTSSLENWTQRLIHEAERHPGLKLIGPAADSQRMPLVSLVSDQLDCHEMAMMLDSALGIEARSGFHCAASIHSYLGTADRGGTLRMSLGHTSTVSDIEAACEGIEMLGKLHGGL